MSCFFDTNVLVYVYDKRDPRKQQIARAQLHEHLVAGSFTISTQVIQEFYAAVRKHRLLTPELALEAASEFCHGVPRPTTPQMVLNGLALSQRYQLSVWDGLILQAALDARCTVLLTEDLQSGMRFGELEVLNPFLLSAHEPVPAYGSAPKRRNRKPA